MKSSLFRVMLILTVLVMAVTVLPACAESTGDTGAGTGDTGAGTGDTGAGTGGTDSGAGTAGDSSAPAQPEPPAGPAHPAPDPWWEICPPVKPRPRTRTVVRQAETLIESIPAEGWCYTAIKRVNVRSQPSTYATKVMTIRAARTEFSVSARVKNSSGEIWYAVKLANGTLGYIRSDLVNTDHVILLRDPYTYEADVDTRPVAASESASEVINIISQPEVTPQIIYVTLDPATQPTPTPIYVYVTPAPDAQVRTDVTPQIIYVTPEPEGQG